MKSNTTNLMILVLVFISLPYGSVYASAETSPEQRAKRENAETIRRLEKLNTIEATREFIQRAFMLEKLSNDAYSSETAHFEMPKKDEREILAILSKWTLLWKDIATYYSEFNPASELEVYGEYHAKLFAAITEATVSSGFVGYRLSSPDHLRVTTKLLELKIEILRLSTTTHVSSAGLLKPRRPKSLQLPDITSKYKSGVEMAKKFGRLNTDFRELYEDTKTLMPPKTADRKFRTLMKRLTNARLSAGELLDHHHKVQLNEIYRVGACLDIIESLTFYILNKTKDPNQVKLGLQIAQLKIESAKANGALLMRLKAMYK